MLPPASVSSSVAVPSLPLALRSRCANKITHLARYKHSQTRNAAAPDADRPAGRPCGCSSGKRLKQERPNGRPATAATNVGVDADWLGRMPLQQPLWAWSNTRWHRPYPSARPSRAPLRRPRAVDPFACRQSPTQPTAEPSTAKGLGYCCPLPLAGPSHFRFSGARDGRVRG